MSRWGADTDPFMAMRHEMNRLFENAFGGFGLPTLFGPASGGTSVQTLAPQMDVSETEREIHVTAELPGIDPKDVEVMLADDRLTIRGEMRTERDEKDRNYHLMERSQGSFSRSLRLPFAADPSQVKAEFKNGVLTVAIQKPKEVLEKQHRIEVQTDTADRPTGSAPSTSPGSTAEQRVTHAAAE
jgi:HSP20 family protein